MASHFGEAPLYSVSSQIVDWTLGRSADFPKNLLVNRNQG